MAEVVPGIAIVAVVFAHGAPLALAEVGPPLPPQDATLSRLREALLLRRARCCRHRVAPFLRVQVNAGPRSRGLPLIAPHRQSAQPEMGLQDAPGWGTLSISGPVCHQSQPLSTRLGGSYCRIGAHCPPQALWGSCRHDHDLHSPVLGPALWGVVGRHRL